MLARQRLLLFGCFFLSGGTSLVLQVAWSKELGYILGNTLYAVATVVAAFMAGLGIGAGIAGRFAPKLRSPVRAYALLQFAIAIAGALSIPILRSTPPLFEMLYGAMEPGNVAFLVARFAVVTLLLLGPVTLMGMTLPVIVGAFAHRKDHYALEAGLVYGINTLGAVAGTWSAGFLLVPGLGLLATTWTAAGIDAAVGALAFVLARSLDRKATESGDTPKADPAPAPVPAPVAPALRGEHYGIGIAFLLSGGLAMIYEVAWFRLLAMTMGPTVYAFSSMLGMFLLGVGAGSALFARFAGTTRLSGGQIMARLEALLGISVLGGLFYFNSLPRWNAELYFKVADIGFAASHLAIAFAVVFVPCLLLGALFPATVRAFREAGGAAQAEANVGRLYVLNTVGGIAGTLAAGFWMLPTLGLTTTLRLSGAASALLGAALFLFAGRDRTPGQRRAQAVAAVSVTLLLLALAPALDKRVFNLGLYREVYSTSEYRSDRLHGTDILYHAEGINCPVTVFRGSDGHASLHVTGKADASTQPADQTTQALLGHLPAFFAPSVKRAAVIGYGSGMTVTALLAHADVETIDVMEIERAVIGASPFFECINGDPLADPRARLVVEDGRVHLTYTEDRYDIIVSEPSNPWIAGVSNLFTVDFYETARDRLTEGGVFGQWVQAYDISSTALSVVMASLSEVFEHVVVFKTADFDFLALASSRPLEQPVTELRRRFEVPTARASLARIGIDAPLELGYAYYASEEAIASIVSGVSARNTDDNVWLEHRMPRDLFGVFYGEEESAFPLRFEPERTIEHLLRLVPGALPDDVARALIGRAFGFEPTRAKPAQHPVEEAARDQLVDGVLAATRSGAHARSLRGINVFARKEQEAMRRRLDAAQGLMRATAPTIPGGPLREADVATAQAAVRAASDLPMARLELGDALRAAQRDDEAREHYERILEHPSSPLVPSAWAGLAAIELRGGNGTEGIRRLRDAVARDPYAPSFATALSRALLVSGRAAEAREVAEESRRFNPSAPELEALLQTLPR